MDYLGWGLVIRSELELPGGWSLEPSENRVPDLAIECGSAGLSHAHAVRPPYRFGDACILFEPPDVARYLIESDRIVVEPHPSAAPDHVVALLIATALPALLWLRDSFVLHASCAAAPDGAGFAFAGPSGSGKSRLCALLLNEGWGVAGDDSITLAGRGGGILASGLPACLHLNQSPSEPRSVIAVRVEQRLREAALRAIVTLRPVVGAESGLQPMEQLGATTALLTNRHRPAVPRGLGLEGEMLPTIGRIVRALPVASLTFDPQAITASALIGILQQLNVRPR